MEAAIIDTSDYINLNPIFGTKVDCVFYDSDTVIFSKLIVCESSCNFNQGYYFFLIPIVRPSFRKNDLFKITFTTCNDTKIGLYCDHITFIIDIKNYSLEKVTVELLKILNNSTFDILFRDG